MNKHPEKKFRKKKAATHHQTNWLWGKSLVMDTLTTGRWRVYEMYVTEEMHTLHRDLLLAKTNEGVELEVVTAVRLAELAKSNEHEGIVARVSKYPYQTLDALAELVKRPVDDPPSSNKAALVVILDRVQDAFSFATILRSCQAFGVEALIIGEYSQAQVTPQIARSSLGAVNHLPVILSSDLVVATEQLKSLGFSIAVVDSNASLSLSDATLTGSTALIVSGDAQATDPKLLSLCDHRVSLPVTAVSALSSSAVISAIMLYETRRQQHDRNAPQET